MGFIHQVLICKLTRFSKFLKEIIFFKIDIQSLGSITDKMTDIAHYTFTVFISTGNCK